MEKEPTDGYYLARKSVELSRQIKIKTVRSCVENALGRKLSPEEWVGADLRVWRELCERAWGDQSAFESPTLEWAAAKLHRQYFLYLRNLYKEES
jgi:hypothetical protein